MFLSPYLLAPTNNAKDNVPKRLPKKNARIIDILLCSFMVGTLLLIVLYEFSDGF